MNHDTYGTPLVGHLCPILACGALGCVKIFKYFVHNPDLKELNELRTRISSFLKLDNGKSGLWVPLDSRLMTSSGHVTKMK